MHWKTSSNNDSKLCDMAAESTRDIKYKRISGHLHEHFGFKLFVTWTKHC